MRRHAKEIVNISGWAAFGFTAYHFGIAGVSIGRWLYGAADTSPPALASYTVALVVGLFVLKPIERSIKEIIAARDTGKGE